MDMLIAFIGNLGLLIIIGLILFFVAPEMLREVYEFLGTLFWPIIITICLLAALPSRRRKRRK